MSAGSPRLRAMFGSVVLLLATAAMASAQSGTITGRVVAAGTSEPLVETRVIVTGTSLVATTGADGRYTVRNAPPGSYTLHVLRVGYTESKKQVDVAAGQTVSVDFTLEPAIVKLTEVVTTATGEQRRVEIGNSVSTIDAGTRNVTAPTTNIASMLVAQAPGVQVLPGNETGTGSRIRIRGVNSITLANDPIYIIDGVRMTSANGSQSGNIFTGGGIQSRAEDINPDEIENVEIVKGPSAATLYGTDAANGVIVITTKRGRAGDTRYNLTGETGVIQDRNTYPTAFSLWGHAPAGIVRNCTHPLLSQTAQGVANQCLVDSATSFNLWSTPNTTPLGDGSRRKASAQISGGVQTLRFFTSGEYENEIGVTKIPDFDVQRADTLHIPIDDRWAHPNALMRGTFRANLDANLSPKLDAAFSSGFITSRNRLPQLDNNALGIGSNGFGGTGYENNGLSTLGFQLHGYRATTPLESFQDVYEQYINRFIGSANFNYRPTAWLAGRVETGLDFTGRNDQQLCLRGECADVGTTRQGFVQDDRTNFHTTTVNAQLTGSWNPRTWLNSKLTGGTQWVSSTFDRNGAGAVNLPPGAQTLSAGATQSTNASTTDTKTLGIFGEEAVAIRDRLFLTAGLRSDQNSAFGTNFQRVLYPKGSVSYIISDESWFRKPSFLDQLRLRLAVGASGVQPGATDALQFLTATTTNVGLVDQPGLVVTSLGNAELRPERATETETGFDSRFFNSRLTLDLTYYSKKTKDALVGAVIPPDLGTINTSQRTNLGSVKNAGLEALISGQVIDRRSLGWDFTLSGSSNANKLLTLGTDAQGRPIPPQVGTTTRNQPGYPLFGLWARNFTFADANNDGIITLSEIKVADSSTFVGYAYPRYEMSLQNGFDLFSRAVRVSATFDHKSGFKILNGTERIRCQSRNNCQGTYDKNASDFLKARAVAVRESPSQTQWGYMEEGDFTRFRELSVSYRLPQRVLTHAMGAHDGTLIFTARNLKKWTNYTGVDPESDSDAGSTTNGQTDFQAVAPPTYFLFRLNLTF